MLKVATLPVVGSSLNDTRFDELTSSPRPTWIAVVLKQLQCQKVHCGPCEYCLLKLYIVFQLGNNRRIIFK